MEGSRQLSLFQLITSCKVEQPEHEKFERNYLKMLSDLVTVGTFKSHKKAEGEITTPTR